MCGIIAYTGKQQAAPILTAGLKQLEYRGYDSAGITVSSRKRLRTWKSAGKLTALQNQLPDSINSNCGIGHTRWATHGAPTDQNAHPHLDQNQTISLVHNGIIENIDTLRKSALEAGATLVSETDTEVLVQLLAIAIKKHSLTLLQALRQLLKQGVIGTYGIAAISFDQPDTIVLARSGSPVIIGVGDGEMLAASDLSALSRHTREVVHLDDGELAELTPAGFEVTTMEAHRTDKTPMMVDGNPDQYDKGGHTHYLYREIFDQPKTLARTLSGRLDTRFNTTKLGGLNLQPSDLLKLKRVKILGCGSALYAGLAGANMIENLSRIPADAEAAAEFRYRNPIIEPETLYIALSQSGETFDTLAAIREIQRKGGFVLGIVNSVGSTIAREVNGGIYMHAGPEVSVASTKAYTSMLGVLALLAILLGRTRDISPQRGAQLLQELDSVPGKISAVLTEEPQIKAIAETYSHAHSAFFVGRTTAYPVALEGAQKLKEISYIHAEAYPASELKHGPLALVTAETPCIIVLPESDLLAKSVGSLEEIKARGAPVIAITDSDNKRISQLADHVIRTPPADPLVQGLIMGVALQLFAYHSAVTLGRDVDQPRNLAKSVTVE
ncbi:glutamine--fructose-6-phosphate aminotransferase [Chromatiales bacterium (ex Bugula neritina AB1)]|nr:glutamine--fructose-6-phosphate aminotransferase [Chromatiales bacterium (ex Bugula neritina AB1)]